MLTHTLVFSFPDSMSGSDRERFFGELANIIGSSGIADSFVYRKHVPLAEESHAPVFVSSAIAEVRCADLGTLEKLSVHPPLGEFTQRWMTAFPYQVVWVNSEDEAE
ncbi:hypothetical protein GCM10027598_79140 [Amycolatopsis oliviviridis]|uniref:Uncharacterized protein n=1 Tax=Amycolatopsis oliviviridis TaxID=1471590 RepID=A0ABQ3L5D4_9PSEU|nr:hypothetical protein [Amycolatopsis oliviviridis]GHH05304.1 hypothetical protein GCM10017790_09070 [Amycolatopsis oliviviridis]